MDANPDSACEEDSFPSEASYPANIQTNNLVQHHTSTFWRQKYEKNTIGS
jgi:hypothetical protein